MPARYYLANPLIGWLLFREYSKKEGSKEEERLKNIGLLMVKTTEAVHTYQLVRTGAKLKADVSVCFDAIGQNVKPLFLDLK